MGRRFLCLHDASSSAYFAIDVVKAGKCDRIYFDWRRLWAWRGYVAKRAKAMGEDGMSFEEILSFYFRDCQLDKIY